MHALIAKMRTRWLEGCSIWWVSWPSFVKMVWKIPLHGHDPCSMPSILHISCTVLCNFLFELVPSRAPSLCILRWWVGLLATLLPVTIFFAKLMVARKIATMFTEIFDSYCNVGMGHRIWSSQSLRATKTRYLIKCVLLHPLNIEHFPTFNLHVLDNVVCTIARYVESLQSPVTTFLVCQESTLVHLLNRAEILCS